MSLQIKEIERTELIELVKNNQRILYRRFSYNGDIPKKAFLNSLIEKLGSGNNRPAAQLGLFDHTGRAHGGVSLHISEWDSLHFGIKIGKTDFLLFDSSVKLHDRSKFFQELEVRSAKMKVQVVFVRHFLDDFGTMIALSKAGGILTDILLTFCKGAKDKDLLSRGEKPVRIRNAYRGDGEAMGDLARRAFYTSHFHSDPNLPRSLSDELYAKWSVNSLNGLSEKVLVAEENGALIGFIACSVKRLSDNVSFGIIDLIVVDPRKRGGGIGRLLITEALDWFSSRTSSIYVGTQATNTPAVRLYESTGFKLVEAEATWHLWIS